MWCIKMNIKFIYFVFIIFSFLHIACNNDNIETVDYSSILVVEGNKTDIKESVLERIKKNKLIVVGTRFKIEPFGFENKEGELVGFDIDIANYIANKLGIIIKFEHVTTKEMFQVLDSDNVDVVISAITHTLERDKTMDFSITYFRDYERIMVPLDSTIKTLSDLKGKTVALKRGISVQRGLKELFNNEIKFYEIDNRPDDFEAVRMGLADAVATDSVFLLSLRKQAFDNGKIKSLSEFELRAEPIKEIPYGIVIKQGESDLRDEINFILIEMQKSGYYKKIFKKWFGKGSPFEVDDMFNIEVLP